MGKFKERNRVLLFGESATTRAENGVTAGISEKPARQAEITADEFTAEKQALIRKYCALDACTQKEIADRISGAEITKGTPPVTKPLYSPYFAAQIEELLQAPPLPTRIMSPNENKLCHVLLDYKFGEEQIAWLLTDPQFQSAVMSTYNRMLSQYPAEGISDDKADN